MKIIPLKLLLGIIILLSFGRVLTAQSKITFTTSKSIGESVTLRINADHADYADVWIDLNDNGIKDSTEAVIKPIGSVTYTIESQKINIYGKVTSLTCYGNSLTSLDASGNNYLTYLHCGDNKLTNLNLSNNDNLFILECCKNQLTNIDISKCSSLKVLKCNKNQIASLDVSNNTNLMALSCSENEITSLNVSKNKKLVSLVCNNNKLKSLDVSKNRNLSLLRCQNNHLTSLNARNKNNRNMSLDATDNPNLRCIRHDILFWPKKCPCGSLSGWCKDDLAKWSRRCK